MTNDTTNLLNICLEIEGLLCLVDRRGDTIPENIASLLIDKVSTLNSAMAEFTHAHKEKTERSETKLQVPQIIISDNNEEEENTVEENLADALDFEEKKDAEPDKEADPAPAHEPVTTTRNDVAPLELTVNDKFRFRRELFANSDVDLAEALQIAAGMSTAEEAEDYFYNDLCFDPENEVVKDFMKVVTKRLL